MNTVNSLKCAAVMLPVLALGMPMANAIDPPNHLTDQRAAASDRSQAHQTTQGGYLQSLPARGYHSDNIVGKDLKNRRNDETVGSVSNLVLDEDGQVVAVIVSVGGIMGIGDRDVAIEWDRIERRADGDDFTLSVDLTEDDLENAPEYSGDRSGRATSMTGSDQRAGQYSDRQDQRTGQTTDRRTAQTTDPRSDQHTGMHAGQQTGQHAGQRGATGPTSEYVENKPNRGYHSDNLVGKEVKSRLNNDSVGTVSNLVLDNDGQVVAVVIGVGGLMGLGQRDVAISWDQIERSYDGDDTTLWVNLTEESLEDAPKYSSDPDSRRTTTRR